MAQTKIIRCDCVNAFQDQRYGKQRRVMNRTGKGTATRPDYRCTVCAKTAIQPVEKVK